MSAFQPGSYYGHSANDDGRGVPELLRDHLARVAEYAARFAAEALRGIDTLTKRVMFRRISAWLLSTNRRG